VRRRLCSDQRRPKGEDARQCHAKSSKWYSHGRRGLWTCFCQCGYFCVRFFRSTLLIYFGQVYIPTLEKINPIFIRAVKHKAIGKQVKVVKGADKGLTGYVYGHNYIQNTFLVTLVNTRTKNFASAELRYLLVCR
jgi:hypothetical protein